MDSFQVHSALRTSRGSSQWVDFGVHTYACMTQPETCGSAGDAISLWIKLDHIFSCQGDDGIMSTTAGCFHTGSYITCSLNRNNMK